MKNNKELSMKFWTLILYLSFCVMGGCVIGGYINWVFMVFKKGKYGFGIFLVALFVTVLSIVMLAKNYNSQERRERKDVRKWSGVSNTERIREEDEKVD